MTQARLCETVLLGVDAAAAPHQVRAYVTRFRAALGAEMTVITPDAPPVEGTIDRADLFVVIGTTVETLDKVARGSADDVMSAAVQRYQRTVLFVPQIDPVLWNQPALRHIRQTLAETGHSLVPPEDVISVTRETWNGTPAPSPDTVLRHLMHVRMKELKREYWVEATREKPLTPAQKRLQARAIAAERRSTAGA